MVAIHFWIKQCVIYMQNEKETMLWSTGGRQLGSERFMKTLFDLLLIKAAEFLKALLKSIRFTALET